MTLRQLAWAALGRRLEEWDRTAALQAWLARVMTGEKLDPAKLNPWRKEQARARRAGPPGKLEDAAAWAILDAWARGRGG